MKKYLSLVAGAMLMTACGNEAETPDGNQASGQEIAVTVDEGSLTRALGEIESPSALAETGFGLFGCYTERLTYENTSVSPDFMYNQKVTSIDNGANWAYNPLKYWPNSTDYETGTIFNEYVTFFAYAPYEENPKDDGRCIFGMSGKYDKGDPWVNYRLAADPWSESSVYQQVDLLYGVNKDDGMPFYDQTKPVFNDKLEISFKHALACIGDKVTITLKDDFSEYVSSYASIIVEKVEIVYNELTTKARLNLNSPSGPNWKELISGELTTSRTLVLDFADAPIDLMAEGQTLPYTLSEHQGLFYIPLLVKGCDAPYADVTVYYKVKPKNSISGAEYYGKVSNRFDLDLNLEGKKQGIELILTKDLDLLHLTYDITTDQANEPSYSRQWK